MARQKRSGQKRLGLRRWLGRRAGRYAKDTEGVALVEFAFLFPILVIVLLMIITLSHMMMIDRKVTITAQAAADLIAQRQDVNNSDINEVRLAAELMMQPFSADFDISVAHVAFRLNNGDADMGDSASWRALIKGADPLDANDVEDEADGANISAPPSAVTGPLGTPGDALIMLRMNYRYRSILVGDFNFLGINIPAQMTFTKFSYARPRLNRQITASNQLLVSP